MPRRCVNFDGAMEVRAFETEDEPGVLEVLQAAFGQWPRGIQGVTPSEFFRWKHMDGPFGPSSLLVAEADGAVIGLLAYMPWRFRASGQTLETLRGVDFALHPDRRRPGASSALTQAAVEHFSSDLAFVWGNPNAQGTPVSLKSGWREVGRLPRFVQPRGPLLGTIQRASGKSSKTPREMRVTAKSAAELLRGGALASLLLAPTKEPGDRLTTAKDLNYLRWRYGQFEEYRAVRIDAGEDGIGMAIFRPRRHGPFWVLDVCELLVEKNDRLIARHLLHQAIEVAPADFLSCSFPSRREAALGGFVQARGREVLVTYPLQQNLVPDSTRRASWALSRGDLELL
jgi:GNAT superfamily N-acetyltransferase